MPPKTRQARPRGLAGELLDRVAAAGGRLDLRVTFGRAGDGWDAPAPEWVLWAAHWLEREGFLASDPAGRVELTAKARSVLAPEG